MLTLSERGLKLSNSWAKYKNGMTTETWNDLKPKRNKEYDEERAKKYMAWYLSKKTSENYFASSFDKVVWEKDCDGINRIRYVVISHSKPIWNRNTHKYYSDGKEDEFFEIPQWNFNSKIEIIA